RIDVLDRLVGAVLQLRAESGIRAGQRAGDAHFELRLRGTGEGDGCAKSQTERGNSFHTPLLCELGGDPASFEADATASCPIEAPNLEKVTRNRCLFRKLLRYAAPSASIRLGY